MRHLLTHKEINEELHGVGRGKKGRMPQNLLLCWVEPSPPHPRREGKNARPNPRRRGPLRALPRAVARVPPPTGLRVPCRRRCGRHRHRRGAAARRLGFILRCRGGGHRAHGPAAARAHLRRDLPPMPPR
jgi:hypothetical protein